MSESIPADLSEKPQEQETSFRLAHEPESRWQTIAEWCLDRFSSISVKEARQALKSYQFFITYSVLVVGVAVATILVFLDASTSRVFNYEQAAENLYLAYLVILGFPLAVIIPFSAYRSLAREYEDGTIQLVSITTMKPYQIVLGKLGTAMLQMVIYLSIVAPCIVFVYLLEGTTVVSIVLMLGLAVGGCFTLTVFGLLLAGASRSHAFGMVLSTAFVLALGLVFIGWWTLVSEGANSGPPANIFDQPETRIATFGMLAFALSTTLIMLSAAASQISFEADNRSTLTRCLLAGQLVFFFAMLSMIFPVFRAGAEFAPIVFTIFIAHYWLLLGSFIVGESPNLSQRVQRSFPKSSMGKALFSLLMPGPGRGLLFTFACLFSCVVCVVAVHVLSYLASDTVIFYYFSDQPFLTNPGGAANLDYFFASSMVMICIVAYPMFYLSVTFLLMKLLHRRVKFSGSWGPITGVLVTIFVCFMTLAISFGLWQMTRRNYSDSYGSLRYETLDLAESLNWYNFIASTARINNQSIVQDIVATLPVMLGFGLTILVACWVASKELAIHRPAVTPARVLEDRKLERESRKVAEEGETIEEMWGTLDSPKDDDATP